MKTDIKIETDRLIMRRLIEDDADDLSYSSKQPAAAQFMSDMVMNTREEAFRWIKWINNDKFNIDIPNVILSVVLKSNKKCIGFIGVALKSELDNEIEILFQLNNNYQNQGYITEAGKAFIDWVFENTPAEYLVAIVKHDNLASNRVINKLGFIYKGEKQIVHDGEMTGFHYYHLEKPYKIISVRGNPEYFNCAVDYFSSKWEIDRKIYEDSIRNSIITDNPLPRWYLMVKSNSKEKKCIIGSYGLITNDFISRQDLWPWICSLYIEESKRGKELGSRLLAHGRKEAGKLGFRRIYLSTDHVGYYEKYGWRYIGQGYGLFGESRIYESEGID